MFTLTRIIGNVPVGALQPSTLDIIGTFACAGTAGGVQIELRLVAPPGVPTGTLTTISSTGAPGLPPVDSVVVSVPWTGGHCGEKIEFEVRGLCNGQWTAWQRFSEAISCFCPRIGNLQIAYGACGGSPPMQSVTVTATVMLNPGTGTSPISCEFGDGGFASQSVPNPSSFVPQTVTFQHDYLPGTYSLCLRSGECPQVCETVHPSCQACCDEVTIDATTQPPAPCLPIGGGPVTVAFTASISPGGCTGPFEWKVSNMTSGTAVVVQPFMPGGATFSFAFASAGTYKVNVRVSQGGDCDDSQLTDSVTLTIATCPPCAVSLTGPQQTACTDAAPTAPQTFTASTLSPYSGPYTWEVTKLPSALPMVQVQGGASYSYAFPGPGTYRVNVSILTPGCTNPTASSSVQVVVPTCSCPPGQHLDASGQCVPDITSCPPGQHLDANGLCVPDTVTTCPPGQHLDASGSCVTDSRIGCDALLWIALILIAISGVLAVIGCVISNALPLPAAVLGIIALALLVIGLLLFLLWWAICRFFTACSVIIAALNFMGVLIAVFGVVGIILALIARLGGHTDLYLCVGVSFFQSAIWGILLYILYRIAVAVKCITENPNGPPPPAPPSSSSSSSSLVSSEAGRAWQGTRFGGARLEADRARGFGDYLEATTAAMGLRPCAKCHERAQRLNALIPLGR